MSEKCKLRDSIKEHNQQLILFVEVHQMFHCVHFDIHSFEKLDNWGWINPEIDGENN